jgi:hypothetical protein
VHLKTLTAACIVAGLAAWSGPLHGATAEELIAPLQQQIDALQRQLDELRQQQSALAAAPPPVLSEPAPSALPAAIQPHFGGQYRINAYSAENDLGGDRQTAARLRLRQNIGFDFDERFSTRLQFELGHTTDNIGTTGARRGGKSTTLSVRHAVLEYRPAGNATDGASLQAGLLPLQDDFRQTQFSADWNYNPLALSLLAPLGGGQLRLFAANLDEGSSESGSDGEFVHYQADYRRPLGEASRLTLSATVLDLADAAGGGSGHHYNYGAGFGSQIGNIAVHGFVLGSQTDPGLLEVGGRARGVAGLLELTAPAAGGEIGLLLSHASGRADGRGFLMPMAFAGSYGYWGYTGILTVQGPTDTGFDFDAVNISNNGFGLSSVQTKYAFPIAERLDAHLGAGWFGNSKAAGRNDKVGMDLLAMTTYRFTPVLALDVGGAYARLEDSVSGYYRGVQSAGGPGFNQAAGDSRSKWALFARLQAEF